MAYAIPNLLSGLPQSPKAIQQRLPPLDTSFQASFKQSPSSSTALPALHPSRQSSLDGRQNSRESLIFANATIPLSPVTAVSVEPQEGIYDGLTPAQRNPFLRLVSCLGRRERARRRMERSQEYEEVGAKTHWTEYEPNPWQL